MKKKELLKRIADLEKETRNVESQFEDLKNKQLFMEALLKPSTKIISLGYSSDGFNTQTYTVTYQSPKAQNVKL